MDEGYLEAAVVDRKPTRDDGENNENVMARGPIAAWGRTAPRTPEGLPTRPRTGDDGFKSQDWERGDPTRQT